MIGREPAEAVGNRVTLAHEEEVAARGVAERRAARVVAGRSTDVEDCRELLGMLGIAAATGLVVTDPPLRRS